MNATATLFDVGEIIARPRREAARVKVEITDEDVTGVAGAALWGPLLDRLNLVDVAGVAGFIRECPAAVPGPVRDEKNLWVRIDSAGYQHDVFATCEQLGAVFSITAPQRSNIRAAVLALAGDQATVWTRAPGAETEKDPRSARP